jgi:hypothetical protein
MASFPNLNLNSAVSGIAPGTIAVSFALQNQCDIPIVYWGEANTNNLNNSSGNLNPGSLNYVIYGLTPGQNYDVAVQECIPGENICSQMSNIITALATPNPISQSVTTNGNYSNSILATLNIVSIDNISQKMFNLLPDIYANSINSFVYLILWISAQQYNVVENLLKTVRNNNFLDSFSNQSGFLNVFGPGNYIINFDYPFIIPPTSIVVTPSSSNTDFIIEDVTTSSIRINVITPYNDTLQWQVSGSIGAQTTQSYSFLNQNGTININGTGDYFIQFNNNFLVPPTNIKIIASNPLTEFTIFNVTTAGININVTTTMADILSWSVYGNQSNNISDSLYNNFGYPISVSRFGEMQIQSNYTTQQFFSADTRYRSLLRAVYKSILEGPNLKGIIIACSSLFIQPYIPYHLFIENNFYSTNNSPILISANQVNQSWNSQNIVWNNQPSINLIPQDTVCFGNLNEWYSFDLTELVQIWNKISYNIPLNTNAVLYSPPFTGTLTQVTNSNSFNTGTIQVTLDSGEILNIPLMKGLAIEYNNITYVFPNSISSNLTQNIPIQSIITVILPQINNIVTNLNVGSGVEASSITFNIDGEDLTVSIVPNAKLYNYLGEVASPIYPNNLGVCIKTTYPQSTQQGFSTFSSNTFINSTLIPRLLVKYNFYPPTGERIKTIQINSLINSAWVDQQYPDEVQDNSMFLYFSGSQTLLEEFSTSEIEKRIFLQFDISSIPQDAVIVQATLEFYAASGFTIAQDYKRECILGKNYLGTYSYLSGFCLNQYSFEIILQYADQLFFPGFINLLTSSGILNLVISNSNIILDSGNSISPTSYQVVQQDQIQPNDNIIILPDQISGTVSSILPSVQNNLNPLTIESFKQILRLVKPAKAEYFARLLSYENNETINYFESIENPCNYYIFGAWAPNTCYKINSNVNLCGLNVSMCNECINFC